MNTLFAKEIDKEKRPWVTENVRHHLLKTINRKKDCELQEVCIHHLMKTINKKKDCELQEVCIHHLLKKSCRRKDSQCEGCRECSNLYGNRAGGSENTCTGEEVRFKPFSC